MRTIDLTTVPCFGAHGAPYGSRQWLQAQKSPLSRAFLIQRQA